MNEAVYDRTDRRGHLARGGITALNLITPGLGLLRVGAWRAGAMLMVAPFILLMIFTFGMGHFPITSYGHAVLALATTVAVTVALYVLSAVLTWRKSAYRSPLQKWSRWYWLTAITLAVMVLLNLMVPLMHRFYKPFYAPSESMAPAIRKGDKFIADMAWRGPYKRGEIIIFNGPDSVRVSRIVAIAGDRIAMHGGIPILNGKSAVQSSQGKITVTGDEGPQSATMLTERLPGDASTYRILDMGASNFDYMPETTVPKNRLFVLGDNRDRSADSRVPPEDLGVGLVSIGALVGRPMYIHWSSDHAKIGMRLN